MNKRNIEKSERLFPAGVDAVALIHRIMNSDAANPAIEHDYPLVKNPVFPRFQIRLRADSSHKRYCSGRAWEYENRFVMTCHRLTHAGAVEVTIVHEVAHLLISAHSHGVKSHGAEYNRLLAALALELFDLEIDCSKAGYFPTRSFRKLILAQYAGERRLGTPVEIRDAFDARAKRRAKRVKRAAKRKPSTKTKISKHLIYDLRFLFSEPDEMHFRASESAPEGTECRPVEDFEKACANVIDELKNPTLDVAQLCGFAKRLLIEQYWRIEYMISADDEVRAYDRFETRLMKLLPDFWRTRDTANWMRMDWERIELEGLEK